jgi:hypothetical protein
VRSRSDEKDPIGGRPLVEVVDFGLARSLLASLGLHVLLLGPLWLLPAPFEPWGAESAELVPQIVRVQAWLSDLSLEQEAWLPE